MAASALRVEWMADGGVALPAPSGELVLPTGTRFSLRITAGSDGELELQALSSPEGVATPLMREACRAGMPLNSPLLRVHGAAGVDRLNLVFVPAHGGAVVQRAIAIRHD